MISWFSGEANVSCDLIWGGSMCNQPAVFAKIVQCTLGLGSNQSPGSKLPASTAHEIVCVLLQQQPFSLDVSTLQCLHHKIWNQGNNEAEDSVMKTTALDPGWGQRKLDWPCDASYHCTRYIQKKVSDGTAF